jgi:CBS domain-containing protein
MGGKVDRMELRDIVTGEVPAKIKPDATVADALFAMMEGKTDYVLVDRTGPDDAYAMVTRWDIIEKAIATGEDLKDLMAVDVARKPLVVTNNLDLDLRWVAKKMAEEGVSKLAVFDKESFVGFVSDVDVLKASMKAKPSGSPEEGC